MKDNNAERFPIVDEEGKVIGAATRGECHNGSRLLHPVVHLHVFNSRGEVYLQKRPEWKDIQPGKWDTAVGGHIDEGETPEQALTREVGEELGITDFKPERVGAIRVRKPARTGVCLCEPHHLRRPHPSLCRRTRRWPLLVARRNPCRHRTADPHPQLRKRIPAVLLVNTRCLSTVFKMLSKGR